MIKPLTKEGKRKKYPKFFFFFRLKYRELFEPDKIRDGESLKKLEKIGGLEGLAKSLDTNLKVMD